MSFGTLLSRGKSPQKNKKIFHFSSLYSHLWFRYQFTIQESLLQELFWMANDAVPGSLWRWTFTRRCWRFWCPNVQHAKLSRHSKCYLLFMRMFLFLSSLIVTFAIISWVHCNPHKLPFSAIIRVCRKVEILVDGEVEEWWTSGFTMNTTPTYFTIMGNPWSG